MKKKVLLFLLIIVSLFTITACGSKKEDSKKEEITPLLYEVTKEGSTNKIYILGTIHIGNLKNTEFAKYVTNAFDESHYVAAEIDNEDSSDDFSELEKMTYKGEDTIKNHLSEETYTKLMDYVLQNDLDYGIVDKDKLNVEYYAKLLVQQTVDLSGLSSDDGIDDYFINKAKNEGKNFLVVEGAEFQDNVLANLPEKIYEEMINKAIDNPEKEAEEAKKLFETWKKGNEEEIWKDDGSSIKEEDKSKYTEEEIRLAEEFDEKILYSRNITMTDKLEEYFNSNYDVFFMVGQDHVVGPKGIVSYLRDRGYKVIKIEK